MGSRPLEGPADPALCSAAVACRLLDSMLAVNRSLVKARRFGAKRRGRSSLNRTAKRLYGERHRANPAPASPTGLLAAGEHAEARDGGFAVA
ncbi:hypothetical protein PPTG_24535 [Phytophthora nicotianae INRA-310]|uniref:Uncharacterized protein n=2 Tax=Phytophthora nicotianae TaxID=4792 RepID=W2PCV6_PHYN3|nr:hypothetical protein PPTG_24535 [Phytophthora nicotianae INRA-310]ETM98872.1 hypothetical protein PPTG_24535 [Phytophthora nicotianae INRA-310]ETO80629.1 hypothetical protein F444_04926 [Phytophthora nicotianae P1976]